MIEWLGRNAIGNWLCKSTLEILAKTKDSEIGGVLWFLLYLQCVEIKVTEHVLFHTF